jgi:threonine dehydrogenase-like Zn-dependent dehydrogenase
MSSLAPDAIEVAIEAWELAFGGAVGRVVEIGAELSADRDRWIGRTVALPGLRACGACLPCRRGLPVRCHKLGDPASMTTTDRLPARLAVAFDDTLRPPAPHASIAALGGTALVAYAAVVRAGVEPNRAAIVVGRGPLSLFVAALVRQRGAEPIRVQSASERPRVDEILAGAGLEAFAIPVIDTSGDAETACAIAAPGATVVLCAPPRTAAIAATVFERGLNVHAHPGAHPDLLPELCAFASAEHFALGPLCREVDAADAPIDDSDERAPIWDPRVS